MLCGVPILCASLTKYLSVDLGSRTPCPVLNSSNCSFADVYTLSMPEWSIFKYSEKNLLYV